MNQIKQLAGQTAVYGMGTIVPRLLNFAFLVPFYARTFESGGMGAITELYAYVVILNVIITLGMETGFFRFSQDKSQFRSVYTTAFLIVSILAILLIVFVRIFLNPIAAAIQYEDSKEFITWFSLIIALDSISAIPFAKLRRENRPRRFATLKLINVGITIALVFFCLKFWPAIVENNPETWFNSLYNPDLGVGYVFLSNLIASAIVFILLLPEYKLLGGPLSKKVFIDLLKYSLPLVIVGIAGSINDVADKILLKFWFTGKGVVMKELGIYGVNFRLAVLMTLFVQMFKYAFEPFLFAQKKGDKTNAMYVLVMDVFVAIGVIIFLLVTFYLDPLSKAYYGVQGKGYDEGLGVVPIILLANLFLGIYFSLSVWYKVTDLTRYAAVMALGGSVITIVLNAILIPKFSYMGSAWARLACYSAMMVASYFWGRKHMPIPYHVNRILIYLGLGVGLYFLNIQFGNWIPNYKYLISTLLLLAFLVFVNQQLKLFKLFFGREQGNK